MRNFILTAAILLLTFALFGQKDSIHKYLDYELRFCHKKEATYGAIAIRNGDRWELTAVYPDTSIMLKMSFSDAALKTRDGDFVFFFDKGPRIRAGSFINNRLNGALRIWYANGQLKDSGNVTDNTFTGTWKQWYQNGQLKNIENFSIDHWKSSIRAHDNSNLFYTTTQGLLDNTNPTGIHEGYSDSWYANGNKESSVQFVRDTINGNCIFYRENGALSSKENYSGGKLIELECYDEKGMLTGSTCPVLKKPVLIHPYFTEGDYIVDQLHKNKNKDIKHEGYAKIYLKIDAKGTVDTVIINSSPDEALTAHIRKIIAAMPPWSPAISHNRAISYNLEVMVPYFRQD
jgi:antitoxin component YwqK of YwqJK toxin-antitoxin module